MDNESFRLTEPMNFPDFKKDDSEKIPGLYYTYDFDLLSVEQCELTRELTSFREDLNKNNYNVTIRDRIKAGGANYVTKAMSFLVREVRNGVVQPFAYENAEKAEIFCKNLPAKDLTRLEVCINDFFYSIGKSLNVSAMLWNIKEASGSDLIASVLSNPAFFSMIAGSGSSKKK